MKLYTYDFQLNLLTPRNKPGSAIGTQSTATIGYI